MLVNNYNIHEQKTNKNMKKLKNLFSWLKRKPTEVVCGCGHHSKLKKKFKIGGEKVTFRIRYEPGKEFPYCLDCVSKMTITCPWCGRPIFIGDYVTLYTPTDPNYKIPEGAVVYSENPLQLVGCQRSDCAEAAADYRGIWEAPGKVKRILSSIERILVTGEPVVKNF